ncbi:TPA: restriction endonuclease subunit S [Escherichia coli]|uniref:restriction endonuclease subunit S n=1 Tax=Escherichia albertii TaxID=208962 RepID=UPI000F5F37E2|nr:restriction endonuclease subunit S [Escherichia albertii]EFA9605754.1 restriction endonuclease subunit S [Escherichia coli]EIU0537576.1 restriction endonuclease subunit S [Escherichia coli]WKU78415.1 restriction endonuclease subunit S [Escherichia albertii]
MSELSYLEKLLDGVEVEWVTLGSMADIGTGSSNRQDESENGIYPFYVRSKNILKSDTFEFDEVAIVIPGEGGIGDIFHYVEGKYALHQRAYRIRITTNAVDTKFLYYFMSSSFKQYILTKSVGATAISIRKPMLEGFKVPIPSPDNPEKSLAIQSEIVRILDKFTALTAELTAELNMRKKQYNYYRDQLLSFDEEQEKPIYLEKLLDGVEVEWLPLSDLVRIRNGKDHKSLSEGEFPVYGSGGIMRYVDTYAYNKPSVLIPRKGSLGNLFFIDVPFWTVDTIFYTEIDEAQIRPKYLYYFLSTVGLGEMNQAGGVPSQTQSVLNKLKIPIPCPDNPEKSLAIQSEIVRILDKFDTLTNSITEGLPREIELRQKQYEYYRDLLFSFPKPETVSN